MTHCSPSPALDLIGSCDNILGIHGNDSPDLLGRLRSAGITDLPVWREEHLNEAVEAGREVADEMLVDGCGTGTLKRLTTDVGHAYLLNRHAYFPFQGNDFDKFLGYFHRR
jgi:hypothetical protein